MQFFYWTFETFANTLARSSLINHSNRFSFSLPSRWRMFRENETGPWGRGGRRRRMRLEECGAQEQRHEGQLPRCNWFALLPFAPFFLFFFFPRWTNALAFFLSLFSSSFLSFFFFLRGTAFPDRYYSFDDTEIRNWFRNYSFGTSFVQAIRTYTRLFSPE